MRIRLDSSIIECSSVRISETWINSGRYSLRGYSEDRISTGFNEINLTSDYTLYFHHCEQLLDIIHEHFDEKPHSIFDFRCYQTEEAYLETIGAKAVTEKEMKP